ncbi:unnamed protein product [Arabidopsis arenosa]|uniref:Uncharacterized protein n=1 Tax=Arabidopsis arenosa TaxID=38785 RepID=A0A8S2AH88_ARAAE|nr:unnamed protein product [Arabidopsis arenosa]
MAERHQSPAAETIPGTPVIREVRTGSGSENFNPESTRRGGLRAEIDIYSPLFSGRGSRVPFNIGNNYVSSLLISGLQSLFISFSTMHL